MLVTPSITGTPALMVNESTEVWFIRGRKTQWAMASPRSSTQRLVVRFEMPGGLDPANIWLLEEEGGWTVVDTCMKLDSAKAQWEQLFDGFMQG